MSHFLFGEFNTKQNTGIKARTYVNEDIFYCFNQETNFAGDVARMIEDNKKSEIENWFLVTSKLQIKNSEDILLPYDKYTSEELFPNGDDREYFQKRCRENLRLLSESLRRFIKDVQPTYLRVFVADGYDNAFEVKKCTIDMMIEALYKQAINSFSLDSTIYDVIL